MLDIIVPVYNEADNIIKLFDEINAEIHSDKRIYVIYDFDEDNTIPVVQECRNNYNFQIDLIKNDLGRGVINALKKGLRTANDDVILVMMADLSDKLDVVDIMVSMMETSNLDVVCGSRYMRGGKQNGGPALKSLFSRMAGLSLHFLTGIPTHDVTNSFKMYSKRLLGSIELESSGGFEIGLEITTKAYIMGYKIDEVPSEWFDREEGESHFHMWKWLPKYMKWYFWCIWCTWTGKRVKVK